MSADQQYQKQRQHDHHTGNLRAGEDKSGETAEILDALSNIDDLPINPQDDAVMGQLISKLTSTTNLSAEEVRSNEWVREYILVLYLCKFPKEDGNHGTWRGWSHGDRDAARDPLDSEKRMMLETLVTSSKLALYRSEDAKVIEESARSRKESYVHNDDADDGSGSGGLLGRLRS